MSQGTPLCLYLPCLSGDVIVAVLTVGKQLVLACLEETDSRFQLVTTVYSSSIIIVAFDVLLIKILNALSDGLRVYIDHCEIK